MAIQYVPDEQIQAYIQKAMDDYATWGKGDNIDKLSFSYEVGSSYIKIISNSWGNTSVHSFIVNKVKPGQRYKSRIKDLVRVGDILMAASWKAPAMNFARGNIFELDNLDRVPWTGM